MLNEPPAKKPKTEEDNVDEEAQDGSAKDVEPPQELEVDAAADNGPKNKESITFYTPDLTLNAMPSAFGNMLMPLTDGGLQYLLAGARANIGVKSGRYMFEAKVMEVMSPAEDPAAKQRSPYPRSQLRIGFSTAGSTLFLGESEDSVSFDSEGNFLRDKEKDPVSQKFGSGDVVTIVLNLERASPNANTVSLFKNGVRVSQPQELPDALRGKTLFPTFTFKNVTVYYNFGPVPMVPMSFNCRMVSDASTKDVAITPPEKVRDGKYEVIFPVGLPDEGLFDWLDSFLEKNKDYTELSDRAILQWAEQSGMVRTKAKTSNDKPEMGFGISMMDDGSVRRVLNAVAPIQQRNYVVMEVRANLIKEERKELLAKWASSGLKRSAAVIMGEPPLAIKKRNQDRGLHLKQAAANTEFRAKQAEEKQQRLLEQQKKQMERERKQAEKDMKKKQDEMKKKFELELKRKAAADKGEEFVEPEEEEPKVEEPEEEEKEPEDEEMPELDPPTVELTAEEKQQWFFRGTVPDLAPYALNTTFSKFSVPEKDDGLDEVKFEWQKSDKCKEYVKQWIRDRKCTTRIEELTPSEWFTAKYKEWQKTLQGWHSRQNAHKQAVAKKASDKASKAAAKEQKKKAKEAVARLKEQEARLKAEAAARIKAEADKKREEAKAKGEVVETPEVVEEPAPVVEEKKAEEEESEDEKVEDEPAIEFEKIDVFGIEDILDVGGSEPLFSVFTFEDWTMMGLRFELHLLAHAFRRDVNDPDRPGMTLEHLPFYYQKYFKKVLNVKFFGVETTTEVVELIRDTVVATGKNHVLESLLPDDMESLGVFVMLTEESRRDRNRRIDLGDKKAKLQFTQPGVAGMANVTAVRPGMPGIAPGGRPVFPGVPPVGVRPAMAMTPAWPAQNVAGGAWPVRPNVAGGSWDGGSWDGGSGNGGAWDGGSGFRPGFNFNQVRPAQQQSWGKGW